MLRKEMHMKLFRLLAFCSLVSSLVAADVAPAVQKAQALPEGNGSPAPGAPRSPAKDMTLLDRQHTNNHVLPSPGADDRTISRLVASVLQQSHYSQQKFDDLIASKFMDRYLDSLDPAHLIFNQGDEEEFSRWRGVLDDLTLRRGDTTPAYQIFERFLERYEQMMSFTTNVLGAERFQFTGTNRYVLNRRDQPRPKDGQEARQLWRDRLRYEYLIEKLNLARPDEIGAIVQERLKKKKPDAILKSIKSSREKKAQHKKEQEAAAKLSANDEGASVTNQTAGTTNATVAADTKPAEPKFYNEITVGLKGKLSEEKADQIAEMVEQKLGKEKTPDIIKAIVAKIEKENAEEIVKIISRRYNRQWKMLREFDSDEVLQIYLTALAHAYDPHSDYMSKSSFDNFNISMRLSLFGIGAVLTSEDGYVKIREVMPGSPAQKSKRIKPNDRIVAVAQATNEPVDVVDMKLNKVVELIRGAKGTEVRLTIIPADAPDPSMRKQVTLIRDEIKLEDQEAKAKIIDFPQPDGKTLRLGVIDLPSFYADMETRRSGRKSTTTDVRRLLSKLKLENVKGVILDLRRNGGGSLEEAINLTGLFIKEGPVVQVRDPNGATIVDSDSDPDVVYEGPLVVMTSRFSASASEILAGALQDYGRAVIVGDVSTHGKGTVQSLLKLAPLIRPQPATDTALGALKYTIRKFYRVSGSSTQLKGVIPDIVLPSANNHADVGEASLTNALAWDTIKKADFEPVNAVSSYLDDLRKRSGERVEKDKDFAYIREEIERYKKVKEERSVSMNEEERFREKKENEQRTESRKKELKARPEPFYKTYDITLKIAEEPGLPAPTVKTNNVVVKATPKLDDEEEEEKDDSSPTVDATIDEAKHILQDLIVLTDKAKGLAGATK